MLLTLLMPEIRLAPLLVAVETMAWVVSMLLPCAVIAVADQQFLLAPALTWTVAYWIPMTTLVLTTLLMPEVRLAPLLVVVETMAQVDSVRQMIVAIVEVEQQLA